MSSFKKMSDEEIRLAKKWYWTEETSIPDIADRLDRDQSTIHRHVLKRHVKKPQGRKRALSEAAVDKLERVLEAKVKKAGAAYEITVDMVRRAARVKACNRTVLNALHSRGIYFHKLRCKPVLTDDDVRDRLAFARKFKSKTEDWWLTHVHMSIDCKYFQVLRHGQARQHAAKVATRGVYRKPGQGLQAPYVKPKKHLKAYPGTPGVMVLGGVGKGKVLTWENIDGQRWNSALAAKMYKETIGPQLRKTYRARGPWTVLEDNDPTGFKSNAGKAAKADANIQVLVIPTRSPDLNVLDYFLWASVNQRMRAQECRWSSAKRETRKAFLRRLRKTAMETPTRQLLAAVRDMRRRCQLIWKAGGGHIEE